MNGLPGSGRSLRLPEQHTMTFTQNISDVLWTLRYIHEPTRLTFWETYKRSYITEDGKFFFGFITCAFFWWFTGSTLVHDPFRRWVSENYQRVPLMPLSRSIKKTVRQRLMVRAVTPASNQSPQHLSIACYFFLLVFYFLQIYLSWSVYMPVWFLCDSMWYYWPDKIYYKWNNSIYWGIHWQQNDM